MQMEQLRKDMMAAMKARDKERKDAISSLVSAVKKNAIDAGCRDDIPEDMVNATIMKELKTVQEQRIVLIDRHTQFTRLQRTNRKRDSLL